RSCKVDQLSAQQSGVSRLTLPDDEHPISSTAEFSNSTSITNPVRDELRDPEIPVSRRDRGFGAPRVLMPVATVHKNGPSLSPVRKIRSPGQCPDVQAICDPEFSQNSGHRQLASRSSLAHPSHESAAFGIGLEEATLRQLL